MSWRYPLYNIAPRYAVTIGPVNDNFHPFVEELEGGLNEHNFKINTFSIADFADDMALRLHLSQPSGVSAGLVGYSNPSLAGWVTIRAVDGWQGFPDDGLRKTFVGRGGTTWLCASLNLYCGTNKTYVGGTPPEHEDLRFQQMGFGYLVALRVNGAVLHETILGSGDHSQDDFRADEFRGAAVSPERNRRDPIAFKPQGGGGIVGARLPVVVDAIVELLPGENLVEVVIMNIRGSMKTYAGDNTYVGPRELIIMEMVR